MTMYSIFMSQVFYVVLAPILTVLYAIWFAGYSNLNRIKMLIISMVCCFGAFWAGDLYLLFQSEQYDIIKEPEQLFQILDGEKSVLGALIGAAITGYILAKILRVNYFSYADAAVPAVALGYFTARIACYVNGDDFGIASNLPWAMSFNSETYVYHVHLARGWIEENSVSSLSVHPTQLYHAAIGFFGFILFSMWKDRYTGERFAFSLIYYGVFRFIIEFYRDDYWVEGELIDQSQWLCLLFIMLGIGLCMRNEFIKRNNKISFAIEASS